MPKINLSRSDWDSVLHILSGPINAPEWVAEALIKEINKQLDKQEY